MKVILLTIILRRQNCFQTVRYAVFTPVPLSLTPTSHSQLQQTPCPRIKRMKAPHRTPLPFPPGSTHLTKTLKFHFCLLSDDSLPSSFRCVIVFFSSVSKTFLTESTRCQHFSAKRGCLAISFSVLLSGTSLARVPCHYLILVYFS